MTLISYVNFHVDKKYFFNFLLEQKAFKLKKRGCLGSNACVRVLVSSAVIFKIRTVRQKKDRKERQTVEKKRNRD